jgi:glyceraldehyde 3-phosphate dehydrogenase
MPTTRVAINGFGRIGRSFFRLAAKRPELEVVAVNDLGNIQSIAYLLKYDTVYGRAPFKVEVREGEKPALIVDGREVAFVSEKEPEHLPWGALDVDVVVESTGFFTSYEKANAHREAGAKRVVITAPVKDEPTRLNRPEGAVGRTGLETKPVLGRTILMGINDHELKDCDISSNASCTTNAASPVMQILHETIGIEKALLNTVHGYTASQSLVDGPSKKDLREGRAAAQNIVPSSTGAAIAVTQALTDLQGKFDGVSMRVPVIAGSIADITFLAKRKTSVEEINSILEKAANDERWKPVFAVTHEPLVSSDILGEPYASIADLAMTRVIDGDFVKVLAWYDNEAGYTHSLIEHVIKTGQHL